MKDANTEAQQGAPGQGTLETNQVSDLIIVTGMSGAGRTEAMHAFEDLGYYCIDNLPAGLISKVVEEAEKNNANRRLAVVCDARNQIFFTDLQNELQTLKEKHIEYKILYLDAADEKLVARYKASRRRHPMCTAGMTLAQGIAVERALLAQVRESARDTIDTTDLLPMQLRQAIHDLYSGADVREGLAITVYSFGFKHGAPVDADIVIDVRFLPNPYYKEELKYLTGLDDAVYDYVIHHPATEMFFSRWTRLLDVVMPGYVTEGKQQLAIAVGCTGGQHRSVALATATGDYLRTQGFRVSVSHRDLALAESVRAVKDQIVEGS
ncbi:MAG: RNase adapter RapZ [Eggerthellaceae bacterium]|nr:RNase adapter RapZ [Eggerthellaceae bacterium]